MASTRDNNEAKMYKLKCSDGTELEISEAAAAEAGTLKTAIDAYAGEGAIPITGVAGDILVKIISYCTKHAEFAAAPEPINKRTKLAKEAEIKAWDKEFIDVSLDTLYDFLMASNYLEVQGLLDLSVDKLAHLISGKTVEEIRTTFNIENDFTPEEENEIKREFPWAFE
ncbi:SKP1-like protein 1A [Typha angustifolia]|uniref:SKP1-like protein 1A n=1 Tax=Typha angustifolia TaxID=59011 RepID=UPI003C2EBF1B